MRKTKFKYFTAVMLFFAVYSGFAGSAQTDVSILEPLFYTDNESLQKIQDAVMPAAKAGNIIAVYIARQAMYALGHNMLFGKAKHWLDVKYDPDSEEIQAWFAQVENKAECGDPFFQVVLGMLHHFEGRWGKGEQEAFELWQKAADSGYPDGFAKLGYAYFDGVFVSKDQQKGLQYTKQAAELGHIIAIYNLGCYYAYGKLGTIDLIKAKCYWFKAAKMGHASSQYNLGWLYDYKSGGDNVFSFDLQNHLARNWYAKAAEQGHKEAQEELREIEEREKRGSSFYFTEKPKPRQESQSSDFVDSMVDKFLDAKEQDIERSPVDKTLADQREARLKEAESHGQIVFAVIPEQGDTAPDPTAVAEIEVALSGHESVALVERQEVDKIIRELAFSAEGYVDFRTGLSLGRIIPAHVMLFISKPSGSSGKFVMIQAVDTALGVNIGTWLEDFSKSDDQTLVLDRIISDVIELSRTPISEKHCVSLVGVRNEQHDTKLDEFASALFVLCGKQLANAPDIILLDRRHLDYLAQERYLTDLEQDLLNSAVIVEGGVRQTGQADKLKINILAKNPGQKEGDSLAVDVPADDIVSAVNLVSKAIMDYVGSDTREFAIFSAEEEAVFFASQSLFHAYWRRHEDAVRMAEAAYVLNPSNDNILQLASRLKGLAVNRDIESAHALSCFLRADRLLLDMLEKEYALSVEQGVSDFPVFSWATMLRRVKSSTDKTQIEKRVRQYCPYYLPQTMPFNDPGKETMRLEILELEERIFRLQLKYCSDHYNELAGDFWNCWRQRTVAGLIKEDGYIKDSLFDAYFPGDFNRRLALLKDLVDDIAQYGVLENFPEKQITTLLVPRDGQIRDLARWLVALHASPEEKRLCRDFCVEMTKHANADVRFAGYQALLLMRENTEETAESLFQVLINDVLHDNGMTQASAISAWMHALSRVLDVHDRSDYNSRLIKYLADNNMTHILRDSNIRFSDMLDNMIIVDGPEKTVAFIKGVREKLRVNGKITEPKIDQILAQREEYYQLELIEGIPPACKQQSGPVKTTVKNKDNAGQYVEITRVPLSFEKFAPPCVIAHQNRLYCIRSIFGKDTVQSALPRALRARRFWPNGFQELSIDVYELPSFKELKKLSLPLPEVLSLSTYDEFDVYSVAINENGTELFAGTRVGLARVDLSDWSVEWIRKEDGLPDGIISALAVFDETLYMGIGSEAFYAPLRLIEDINPVLFASYNIKEKTFAVIESEVSVEAGHMPISSENAVVASIFPDKEQGCLWLTLAKKHTQMTNISRDPGRNFQFWQYFPDSNTFHGVANSCVVMPDSRLIGSLIAKRSKLFLFSPETASYAEFPATINWQITECIAATWLGNDILYSVHSVELNRWWPCHMDAELYLYQLGTKKPVLLKYAIDDLKTLDVFLLVTTDYGVLAMGGEGAFLINPKKNKE